MEIFKETLSYIIHLPGMIVTNSLWLDNDPGLFVCGVPIALIGLGIYHRVIRAFKENFESESKRKFE